MSFSGTPIIHISGEKTIPRINSNDNSEYGVFLDINEFNPTSPKKRRTPFNSAIRDINTNNIAATFTAILTPSLVPVDIADKKLLPILELSIEISDLTS